MIIIVVLICTIIIIITDNNKNTKNIRPYNMFYVPFQYESVGAIIKCVPFCAYAHIHL